MKNKWKYRELNPATGLYYYGIRPTGPYWITKKTLDKMKASGGVWRAKNRSYIKWRKRQWQKANPEKGREATARFAASHPERVAENCRKQKQKQKLRPMFRLRERVRVRIWKMLRSRGLRKHQVTTEILGCTIRHFKKHIESLFTKGMTWDLLMTGAIHLDHIRPLRVAKTEAELIALFNYKNYQPLWAKHNLQKNGRLNYRIAA